MTPAEYRAYHALYRLCLKWIERRGLLEHWTYLASVRTRDRIFGHAA